ncbi:MAG: glycosyltransferase family 4 protein [Methylophilus sp.]
MSEYDSLNSNNTDSPLLRIGFYSTGWPLSSFPNGIIAYIQNMLAGLEGQAHSVVLTDQLKGQVLDEEVIDITRYTFNKSLSMRLLDKVLARLKSSYADKLRYSNFLTFDARRLDFAIQQSKINLDILEIEESFGMAYAFTKVSDIPIVTRLHGPHFTMGAILKVENARDYKLRVFYEGEAIKNSHGVTSPSLDVLNRVREYYNIELPFAQVIPNSVQEVAVEHRWQYDAKRQPYILFVGRFDSVKGGDLILKTFRIIAQNNKEITLNFVGPDRGVICDGKELKFYEYLEREIPELEIRARIQFLSHQPSEAIKILRKNSLVTIFPSRYENFPVSLLEALSAGCPTVTTPVGGIKEIVIDGYNGLLAEPDSAESIADRTLALLNDVDLMLAVSKNAIEDCQRRFYPKVVATQALDFYKRIVSKQ